MLVKIVGVGVVFVVFMTFTPSVRGKCNLPCVACRTCSLHHHHYNRCKFPIMTIRDPY